MTNSNENEYILGSVLMFPPTYLRQFIQNEEVLFLYSEKLEESNHDKSAVEEIERSCRSDVTGSPLKVDLKGDDSCSIVLEGKHYYPWTHSEGKYHPLPIGKARRFTTDCLKKKSNNGKPIYAICEDDNNHSRIVALGVCKSKNLTTNVLNYMGFKDYKEFSLEQIESNHYLNCGVKKCDIAYLVTSKYTLYGTFLHDIKSPKDCEYYGNISIEMKSSRKCNFGFIDCSSEQSITLQILAGHYKSTVNFLWQQLDVLQTYIDILSNPGQYQNMTTPICDIPVDFECICSNIKEILNSKTFGDLQDEQTFDLTNIRSISFMDQLWDVYKYCADLGTLRDSFTFLFESLVESTIAVPIMEKSSLATLIRGLLEGKLGVPTLRYSQALAFLFELGAEKLKNVYEAIIKNHCLVPPTALFAEWENLHSKLNYQESFQKIRSTVCFKQGHYLENHILKLSFLTRMHVTVEMFCLLKNESSLPNEIITDLSKAICKSYTDPGSVPEFKHLKQIALCELTMVINSVKDSLNEAIPTSWQMDMTSNVMNTEVKTIYHLSKHQILPFLQNVVTESSGARFYHVYSFIQNKEL